MMRKVLFGLGLLSTNPEFVSCVRLEEDSSSACNKDTGGTCLVLSCDGSRNATCKKTSRFSKKCLCTGSTCAQNSKCVEPTPAPTPTPTPAPTPPPTPKTDGALMTAYDKLCLDYNPSSANVYMYTCHGGKNQQWHFDGQLLKTKHDDKCLDYNYNNMNVYMHKCHGKANQQWYFNGQILKTKKDDKCLDYNYNTANVFMHPCHEQTNQRWQFH